MNQLPHPQATIKCGTNIHPCIHTYMHTCVCRHIRTVLHRRFVLAKSIYNQLMLWCMVPKHGLDITLNPCCLPCESCCGFCIYPVISIRPSVTGAMVLLENGPCSAGYATDTSLEEAPPATLHHRAAHREIVLTPIRLNPHSVPGAGRGRSFGCRVEFPKGVCGRLAD